ncbi:MAG: hypothetical protein IT579_18705 [Verrucomicrobia subdivision 3 bacterium]|nr:hypothetical protein [Limisphaerales bacterium]
MAQPNQKSNAGVPTTGADGMLRHLKLLLTLTAGRPIGAAELSQLTGRAAGTIENWLAGEPMQQVDFIFRLLERLPLRQQHEWWQAGHRLHPSLHHPRLAHDPLVVRQLQALLAQPHGLTVIRGDTVFHRAFLLMALGNSAWLGGARVVTGIDRTNLTDWATPPQVQCLAPQLEAQFQSTWAEFRPPPGSLVLLGGLGIALSTPKLEEWAKTTHVIMTDASAPAPRAAGRPSPRPDHWLTVAGAREQPEWLRVTIHAG